MLALCETPWLPLDDLLVVTREFINEKISRSGLQRLLKRHGVSWLPREAKVEAFHKPFKASEPGYRRQIPAPNGRRDSLPLSLRGHRSCHPLGLHPI